MARPLRIQYPGALYHVMSRGNQKLPIVRDDVDRRKRLQWLQRTVETYGWALHAFVLMRNHEHLFVQTPEANLSAGMHLLNGSYTGYFNRRHHRVGHLFQGRFKGHLIEEEGYYLEVSRYIHLNPVRARLARRPEQYRWSSYAGYQRASRTLRWVTYDGVLGEFGRDSVRARRSYTKFVRAGLQPPPKSPFVDALGGLLLGSDAFITRIRRKLEDQPPDANRPQLQRVRQRPTLGQILDAVLDHFGQQKTDWSVGRRTDDTGRAIAAYLARRRFGYPATAIAEALGYRGHSSVNYAVKRVQQGDTRLQETVRRIEQKLAY